MQDRFSTYLKGIASQYLKEVPKDFFEPLPDVIKEAVQSTSAIKPLVKDLHIDPVQFLEGVHYTWLLPIFNRCSDEEKYLYYSLLPKSHQEALLGEWKIEVDPLDLSAMAKSFFFPKFFEKWHSFPMISAKDLTDSPLKGLISLEKKNLAQLVDYLGLYDLSRELYPIVDGALLRKIINAFSPAKQKFLKRTMRVRPKILASPFGIKKWDGDPKRLKSFTHFRGLVWFSQALSLEGEDFWWYLTHRLDIGRAHVLVKARKNHSKMEVKKLTEPLLDLMHKLQF